jgi:salicylate hydroxylase
MISRQTRQRIIVREHSELWMKMFCFHVCITIVSYLDSNLAYLLKMPSEPSTAPFRAAIIGGGIGGLTTALFLHEHCRGYNIAIDVYEQASEYREIGAGVGIGFNAAQLLHEIGLGEACNAIDGDHGGIWLNFGRWDTGEAVLTLPAPTKVLYSKDGKKSMLRSLSVARSDFLDLLVREIGERGAAKLWTKKKCVAIQVFGSKSILERECNLRD